MGINNSMMATIDAFHSPITNPPGLIKFEKDGIAFTVLQNCSPTEEAKSEKLDKNLWPFLCQKSLSTVWSKARHIFGKMW
jgi:hypothetical protein